MAVTTQTREISRRKINATCVLPDPYGRTSTMRPRVVSCLFLLCQVKNCGNSGTVDSYRSPYYIGNISSPCYVSSKLFFLSVERRAFFERD